MDWPWICSGLSMMSVFRLSFSLMPLLVEFPARIPPDPLQAWLPVQ